MGSVDGAEQRPFRVLTYNVLAPVYAFPMRYPYCDEQHLDWDARSEGVLGVIVSHDADIICLQVRCASCPRVSGG
jgi:mRNA deadenylase 3'-5' endonuclease subunit Ccr4